MQSLVCRYGGSEIFRGAISTGIAANPYLRFFTRAKESGEIEFDWVDDLDVRGNAVATLRVVD
ncbi:MAG: thiosulfate oxidation carrier complex protein SoxZ [Burkholderiales bacterium]